MDKKVLVIGGKHPKYDSRVWKSVKALSKSAYVYYQYYTNKDERETEEGNIYYIPVNKQKENLAKKLKTLSKTLDYDVLYIHHFAPERPLEIFKIAKRRGKMVVYDIHEYYPINYTETALRHFPFLKILARLIESYFEKVFKTQLMLSDKLIFISHDFKRMIESKYGNVKESIVVYNSPEKFFIPRPLKERKKEIVFFGGTPRGFSKEDADILNELNKMGFEVVFIGIKDVEDLKGLKINFVDFLPYEKLVERVSYSTFSWCLFKLSDPRIISYTMPNKVLESICAGTPVIISEEFTSASKFVKENSAGVIINPEKKSESIQKILEYLENYDKNISELRKHQESVYWSEEAQKKLAEFVLF